MRIVQPSAGTRFGPYEIVALLGAGGMGAVYRATDVRLKRDVALKLLPGATAADPARQLRLLEEARAAGSLAHPNILTVYDFGVQGATPYLVAELVDGRRLRDEIDRGVVPLKRVMDLVVQIGAGLAAAHARGLAHLDLKPENVMVARDGRVKIVDFGLAQFLRQPAPPLGVMTDSQAETVGMAGTAPYMSPEQARGAPGDFRSDQFAFGLMLYELATGIHPLRRATAAETLTAIVEEEPPPIAERSPNVPAALRWIIDRCLAKDPDERYASTADLARDLAVLRERLVEVARTGDARTSGDANTRRISGYLAIAALALLAVSFAFVASGANVVQRRPTPTPVVTYTSYQGAPSWSPDGKTLAYVAQVDGVLQVFTRSLSSTLPGRVTASRFDCNDPFWAPDGSRIYYHSLAGEREGLYSIAPTGGSPVLVVPNASRTTISPDGKSLVFSRESEEGLIGQSLWFTSLASPQADLRRYVRGPFSDGLFNGGAFSFSPDGTKLLAWTYWTPENGLSESRLWIAPWPDGEPYEVLKSLGGRGLAGVAFDWVPDSRHVVIAVADERSSSTSRHLWIADVLNDTLEQLTTTLGSENAPTVARDGSRVAFTSESVDFDLFEIPLNGLPLRELLATSRSELDAAWSPQASQFAFVSDRTGALEIILRTLDGSFERSLVDDTQFKEDPTRALGSLAFSSDGLRLAYQRLGDKSGYQIWISTVSGGGPATAMAPGLGYQDAPTWSPDGTQVAFTVTPEGKWALATAVVGAGIPKVIYRDIEPYSRPAWSPDGRWILCASAEGLVLVSPDGATSRTISDEAWLATSWNSDGTQIYGLRESERRRHFMLVALDPVTGTERVINPDLGIIPPANQPIRGLSPIGKTGFLTSIARARSDIWMLEGLPQREGRLDGILARLWGNRQ